MTTSWTSSLRYTLSRKARTINYVSSDRYNYRTDMLGAEAEYCGFRSAVLYFQLDSLIDREVLKQSIKIIESEMGPRNKTRFATLFLNNHDLSLLYPPKMVQDRRQVAAIIDDFYDRFAVSHQQYSGTLHHLFPPTDLYATYRPGRDDLFVLFQGSQKVKMAPELLQPSSKKNWICITAEKDQEVIISTEPPALITTI